MDNYCSHTDDELLALIKTGDCIAFTEVYNRYWKLLFSIAANKLTCLADAEELVQEVFADLWKRRETLEIERSIKSYLSGAVKFQVYSALSKQYRARKNKQMLVFSEKTFLTPKEQLDLKMLEQHLYNSANELPDRCRLIYKLSRETGWSNEAIASHLDISPKTVEAQLTKALKHLKTSLRAFFSFF